MAVCRATMPRRTRKSLCCDIHWAYDGFPSSSRQISGLGLSPIVGLGWPFKRRSPRSQSLVLPLFLPTFAGTVSPTGVFY